MRKFKFFIDYDKEEKWLEDMAKQGFRLCKVYFSHKFKPAPPEDVTIRIDYRTFKNNQDYREYLALFEDSGWRHIAGKRQSGAQYFEKTDGAVSDDIFSDAHSRAGRYKRVSNMWMGLSMAFIVLFFVTYQNEVEYISHFFNPKSFYYTPGLWERTGWDFWFGFLFETPFALVRGYWWLVILLMVVFYIVFALKSWRLYKSALK